MELGIYLFHVKGLSTENQLRVTEYFTSLFLYKILSGLDPDSEIPTRF